MDFPYDPDFQDSKLLISSSGSPVKIYVGRSVSLNCVVVYKVLELIPNYEYLVPYFKQEFELALKFTSPNICRVFNYKEVASSESRFHCIVMEKLDRDWGQEIEDRRINQKGQYPEKVLWERLYVLIATLSALQQNGAAHRDIKPPNIFLHGNGFGQVKLGDFGSCREIAAYSAMQTLQGTPFYLSPKAQRALTNYERNVTHNAYKSDVFSLGMTFFHAIFLEIRPHWFNMSLSQQLVEFAAQFPYSDNLKRVLFYMVQEDEESRADFMDLATWFGLTPDLAYSLDKNRDWNVCCYQCAERDEHAQRFTAECGHFISFCREDCLSEFCASAGEYIPCKICMGYVSVAQLRSSLFSPVVTEMSLAEPASELVQMAPGVCEICSQREQVFQICHPLCFLCAGQYAQGEKDAGHLPIVCRVCRVKFPKEMLDFLGLSA